MNSSEVTIAIFTDYSKAFDTIDFSILFKKIHTLNFSKHFLYWIFNYLTDRRHFVQIDSSISNILITNFGVPQGSILGPILFNLCVADMTNNLSESQCVQCADDFTIYKGCKANEVTKCSSALENELKLLEQWSKIQLYFLTVKRQCYFQQAKCRSTINFIIMLTHGPKMDVQKTFIKGRSCLVQFANTERRPNRNVL